MKRYLLAFFTLTFSNREAFASSICQEDSRMPVENSRIGKVYAEPHSPQICTVTLIGRNCAITAGHCSRIFKMADFQSETFLVDETKTLFLDKDIGLDWALIKFKAHSTLKKYPGELFGYYKIDQTPPIEGESISISGFGEDLRLGERNSYTLQEGLGVIISAHHDIFGDVLTHDADTMGGNSGSAIIRASNDSVMGIHTHNGCGSWFFKGNMGTSIFKHKELQEAIKACQK